MTKINDKDNNGSLALMFASIYGHKEMINLLSEKGANITGIYNYLKVAKTLLNTTRLDYIIIYELLLKDKSISMNDEKLKIVQQNIVSLQLLLKLPGDIFKEVIKFLYFDRILDNKKLNSKVLNVNSKIDHRGSNIR